MKPSPVALLLIGGFTLALVSSPSLQVFRYTGGILVRVTFNGGSVQPPQLHADFDGDGNIDEISLQDGVVEISSSGKTLYRSNPDWIVKKAEFADLNRDGKIEAVLLVWRDFAPWPIDRLLPAGGRISSHQNSEGKSCHLILIGWEDGRPREAWAGSALAQPVIDFAAADLDGDGRQELATLDGDYVDPPDFQAKTVRIWEWNGFGFTRLEQIQQPARQIYIVGNGDSNWEILVSAP